MARRIALTPEQEAVLVAAHRQRIAQDLPFKSIITAMRDVGCHACEDTLRRILVRLGEVEPVGAKYVPTERQTWTRPCIRCGRPEKRPRNLYFCTSCADALRRQGDY